MDGSDRQSDRRLEGVVSALRVEAAELRRTLDRVSSGVFLLDRTLRVRWCNRAARRMLRGGDGLTLVDGTIGIARGATCAANLRDAMRQVRDCVETGDEHSRVTVRVDRADNRGTFIVEISRLDSDGPEPPLAGPRVLLQVADVGREVLLSEKPLFACFGLTPSEARVASGLVNGCSLADIARQLGLCEATVRQYSKSVLAKTNTRRQAELTRLLTSAFGMAER